MLRAVRSREETEGEGGLEKSNKTHEVYQSSPGPAFYLLEGSNKQVQGSKYSAATRQEQLRQQSFKRHSWVSAQLGQLLGLTGGGGGVFSCSRTQGLGCASWLVFLRRD